MEYYDSIMLVTKTVVVGLVFIAVIFFVLRPLMKSLSEKPYEPRKINSFTPRRIEEEELEIPNSKSEGEMTHEKIIKMARDDPNKTAQLVRNWLYEKK